MTTTLTSKTLDDIAQEIIEINKANGWEPPTPDQWDNSPIGKLSTNLVLIASEVIEALEAFRKNDKGNFVEELADTVIRALELCYGLGESPMHCVACVGVKTSGSPLKALGDYLVATFREQYRPKFSPRTIKWECTYVVPDFLMEILCAVASANRYVHQDCRRFFINVGEVINMCAYLAAVLHMDLDDAVTKKLAKNRTRGYRHGGKRVCDDPYECEGDCDERVYEDVPKARLEAEWANFLLDYLPSGSGWSVQVEVDKSSKAGCSWWYHSDKTKTIFINLTGTSESTHYAFLESVAFQMKYLREREKEREKTKENVA